MFHWNRLPFPGIVLPNWGKTIADKKTGAISKDMASLF